MLREKKDIIDKIDKHENHKITRFQNMLQNYEIKIEYYNFYKNFKYDYLKTYNFNIINPHKFNLISYFYLSFLLFVIKSFKYQRDIMISHDHLLLNSKLNNKKSLIIDGDGTTIKIYISNYLKNKNYNHFFENISSIEQSTRSQFELSIKFKLQNIYGVYISSDNCHLSSHYVMKINTNKKYYHFYPDKNVNLKKYQIINVINDSDEPNNNYINNNILIFIEKNLTKPKNVLILKNFKTRFPCNTLYSNSNLNFVSINKTNIDINDIIKIYISDDYELINLYNTTNCISSGQENETTFNSDGSVNISVSVNFKDNQKKYIFIPKNINNVPDFVKYIFLDINKIHSDDVIEKEFNGVKILELII
jgi:hypothetical protein